MRQTNGDLCDGFLLGHGLAVLGLLELSKFMADCGRNFLIRVFELRRAL